VPYRKVRDRDRRLRREARSRRSEGHAAVWAVREGKGVRVQLFPTWAEALEAAGLREQRAERETMGRRRSCGWAFKASTNLRTTQNSGNPLCLERRVNIRSALLVVALITATHAVTSRRLVGQRREAAVVFRRTSGQSPCSRECLPRARAISGACVFASSASNSSSCRVVSR
jgi:hypothetical protein